MIILDTNVLSELMKLYPAEGVVQWLEALPPSTVYTTSISEAEVLYGVKLLPAGERRRNLEMAAHAMFTEDFSGRVLPFESRAASHYSELAAYRRQAGRPISAFDAQIAAIARAAGGTLATRNIDDFAGCGIDVLNPWSC